MGPSMEFAGNADADSLYQEARSHWRKRTPISIRMAIRCLEKAVLIDGTFPLACAALADCYSILMDYGVLSPKEGLTAARLASGRALNQGPELAESLTAAALVRQMDLDWASAEVEFEAALALHPGYAVARQRYALFLAYMGRWSESRREMDAALALDPEDSAVAASAAWVEYYQGQTDKAIETAEEAVLGHPMFSSAEVVLALSLIEAGRPDDAGTVLQKASERETDNVSLVSLLSYARGKEGEGAEARRLLTRLQDWGKGRYISPYYLAVPLMGLGLEDEALSALSRGKAQRSPHLVYLAQEPIFKTFRLRPQFQAILESLGLPYRPELHRSHTPASLPRREVV